MKYLFALAKLPRIFEQLLVDLLIAMGYGGSSEGMGHTLGQTGDNGVDGVINQDPLGVDQVYIQAKRYAQGNNVGSGDIRDFFGALNLKKPKRYFYHHLRFYSFSHSNRQRPWYANSADQWKRISQINVEI